MKRFCAGKAGLTPAGMPKSSPRSSVSVFLVWRGRRRRLEEERGTGLFARRSRGQAMRFLFPTDGKTALRAAFVTAGALCPCITGFCCNVFCIRVLEDDFGPWMLAGWIYFSGTIRKNNNRKSSDIRLRNLCFIGNIFGLRFVLYVSFLYMYNIT